MAVLEPGKRHSLNSLIAPWDGVLSVPDDEVAHLVPHFDAFRRMYHPDEVEYLSTRRPSQLQYQVRNCHWCSAIATVTEEIMACASVQTVFRRSAFKPFDCNFFWIPQGEQLITHTDSHPIPATILICLGEENISGGDIRIVTRNGNELELPFRNNRVYLFDQSLPHGSRIAERANRWSMGIGVQDTENIEAAFDDSIMIHF